MKQVSNAYKNAMNNLLRERGFISVTLSEINGIAQNDCYSVSGGAIWSNNTTPLVDEPSGIEYATFEENFCKADGKHLIMSRNRGEIREVGYCSADIIGNEEASYIIRFGNTYTIKGLTINFGEAYPTSLIIKTNINTNGTTYTNDSPEFVTEDTFGDINSITIIPLVMVGGEQRFRVKRVLMGVGLSYSNEEISEANLTEEVSSISADLPNTSFSVKVLDPENKYNVNNKDSFIDYLITGQKVTVSYGMMVDAATEQIEWIKAQTLLLSDWSAKDGEFSFSATDLLSSSDATYTLGNRIHGRTAYMQAESILQDLGLTADMYDIDDYLRSITLLNPMPEDTHANCLLLLCNACRCIMYQDENGIIKIKTNFALNLEPKDIRLSVSGVTTWSMPGNILKNTVTVHYADFSNYNVQANGSWLIMPREHHDCLDTTGYVTKVANSDGLFDSTPSLTLGLDTAYTYYGLHLNFSGNPPRRVQITTYKNNAQITTFEVTDLHNTNYIEENLIDFDKLKIEFTEAEPNSRVSVDYVGLGDITNYTLSKDNMTSKLLGAKEETVKDIAVKVYTYRTNEDNEMELVNNDVWITVTLNSTGRHVQVENPLIHNTGQAQLVAEWLKVYYQNAYTYECDYRGEPRLNAADIIKVEDEYMNNLQVSIDTAELNFKGSFSGKLKMRRAMRT